MKFCSQKLVFLDGLNINCNFVTEKKRDRHSLNNEEMYTKKIVHFLTFFHFTISILESTRLWKQRLNYRKRISNDGTERFTMRKPQPRQRNFKSIKSLGDQRKLNSKKKESALLFLKFKLKWKRSFKLKLWEICRCDGLCFLY